MLACCCPSLRRSIPPLEFREIDMSTGAPRPRPVDIMLGDMRPNPYPADMVRQQNAMAATQGQKGGGLGGASAKPKSVIAFSGAGQTLGGATSAAADTDGGAGGAGGASTGGDGGGGDGAAAAWPSADRPPVTVDATAPCLQVQVRLPSGPARLTLNTTHTVADLKALVEAALKDKGEAPRKYTLAAGFPPKPLSDDAMTVEAAGLAGASVTHRWA